MAKPEVGAPSGCRVRRTSPEPHLRGAKLKGHARNRWRGSAKAAEARPAVTHRSMQALKRPQKDKVKQFCVFTGAK